MATSDNHATTQSNAASIGVGAGALTLPRAFVKGGTKAAVDGDVKGDATTVQATSTNKAEATTKVISFGLVAGLSGASAYAEVSTDATTEAIVDVNADFAVPNAAVLVKATGTNSAIAVGGS